MPGGFRLRRADLPLKPGKLDIASPRSRSRIQGPGSAACSDVDLHLPSRFRGIRQRTRLTRSTTYPAAGGATGCRQDRVGCREIRHRDPGSSAGLAGDPSNRLVGIVNMWAERHTITAPAWLRPAKLGATARTSPALLLSRVSRVRSSPPLIQTPPAP